MARAGAALRGLGGKQRPPRGRAGEPGPAGHPDRGAASSPGGNSEPACLTPARGPGPVWSPWLMLTLTHPSVHSAQRA